MGIFLIGLLMFCLGEILEKSLVDLTSNRLDIWSGLAGLGMRILLCLCLISLTQFDLDEIPVKSLVDLTWN